MSTIKAAIYKKLVALGITKWVYESSLPRNPRYPATVYQLIDTAPTDLTHDEGVVGFKKTRLQIEVYAEDVAEAESAIGQYFEALKSFSEPLGDGLSPETSYDVDTWDEGQNPDMDFENEVTLAEVTGRSRDFMIHYQKL